MAIFGRYAFNVIVAVDRLKPYLSVDQHEKLKSADCES